MAYYILRRLGQAVLTIMGIMLVTFVLFYAVAGDISRQYVNEKLGKESRQNWLERHHLNIPVFPKTTQFWKSDFWNTQFFWHLRESVTFEGRSYRTDQRIVDVIKENGKYSLALTVPAMALGWLVGLVVASLVAYYRGTWLDRVGVLLTVLGMCIPYLAYMIAGQAIMFEISPAAAWGLRYQTNIYVPVAIMVVAGLGGTVRFYRTIILDETGRDYVRTAKAKGVPLPGILFKHVLKNCMLPILTQLIMAIPFLIMGSLLLEQFFGIPGVGDLMLASITDRDIPIVNGLVFLEAIIYVIALLITDVLYAVFDPRIRLR